MALSGRYTDHKSLEKIYSKGENEAERFFEAIDDNDRHLVD